MTRRTSRTWLALVALTLLTAACSGDDDGGGKRNVTTARSAGDRYEATIRRTAYGIPHVVGADLGSAAFGEGYAAAEDHACDVADQVVKVRSERAKFFGPGEADINVDSDFAYLALGVYDRAEKQYPALSDDTREVLDGYTAGYNAHLDKAGVDNVSGWCAGEDWVRPVTPVDLLAYYRDLLLLASGRQLTGFIASAQPPEPGEGEDGATSTSSEAAGFDRALERLEPAVASNGWAIGADKAAEGHGLLLANPHFPWEGELRLWEVHLTVPGELDVYGAALHGVPGVLIGFNDAVAWTHTVSAGNRFTVYRLDLVPGDPTSYLYDGESRAMESQEYTIEVKDPDGEESERSRTLWRTHYGPVLDFPGVGWTEQTTLAYRDANIDNEGFLDQFLGMDRARSLDELQRVHESVNGVPWVNTMAVSADGTAWYADTAATPNLSDEAIRRWQQALEEDEFTRIAYDNGAVLLDGSDSTFEWVEAPGARSPGLVPYADQPELERDDYVFNANGSYWLANPHELLTGYSPMHGEEETVRSPRTRMNAVMLEEGGGDDGKFTLDELQDAALANRALTAELLKDGVVRDGCAGATGDAATACDVLRSWDGRFEVESRGAALWRLFLEQYSSAEVTGTGPLFREPFDPADPVGTPRGPALDDPANAERARSALAQAVADLRAAGLEPEVALGDVQFTDRTGERLPIPGGPGDFLGITNAIDFSPFSSTLEEGAEIGDAVREGSSLTADGWPVNYGTSFLMALEFTADGPHARAVLTYSESSDPQSPHHGDQTRLFSEGHWRDILYTDEQIAADPELREYVVSAARGS